MAQLLAINFTAAFVLVICILFHNITKNLNDNGFFGEFASTVGVIFSITGIILICISAYDIFNTILK